MRQFVQMRLWPDLKLHIATFGNSDADKRLNEAAEYCRAHSLEPEFAHASGSAKAEILSHAQQWGADLIVMGNSANNLLLRKLFGETALHIIRQADRPLFISQ